MLQEINSLAVDMLTGVRSPMLLKLLRDRKAKMCDWTRDQMSCCNSLAAPSFATSVWGDKVRCSVP
ncbi:hypothetical protein GCM10011404_27880 [Sphingomonas prati]|nr:hypothetical protein GCM10011404_27880 [Sphingomonas prati]